jgi:hypothetical protein
MFFKLCMISFLSMNFAHAACVKEGSTIGNRPGAPACCPGLGVKDGKCANLESISCVKKGDLVGKQKGASKCCEGSKLVESVIESVRVGKCE